MDPISRICLPKLRRNILALTLTTALPASAQLPLQQDDVVCLVGNALADRMQHDGWVNNANLALYTNAIKQVAAENGTAFVDLFTSSQTLYAKAKTPLTLNGVHPLPEGNRQLGEVNGKIYAPEKGVPPMTASESLLGDNEMAAVLTYVRSSWGNQAAPVLPETVKKVRAANKSRSIFWKPEELLKDHPMESPQAPKSK